MLFLKSMIKIIFAKKKQLFFLYISSFFIFCVEVIPLKMKTLNV